MAARAADVGDRDLHRSASALYFGFIERPGEPSGAISLNIGWFGILLGAILMLVGSFMRQAETEVTRKPPGTL